MTNAIREMRLMSAVHETKGQLSRLMRMPNEDTATLLACWTLGTYVGPLFAPYPYLGLQTGASPQWNGRLLEVFGALIHQEPFYMCATRQRCNYQGTMRLVPTVFTSMADLRSPLKDRCVRVVLDDPNLCACASMDDSNEDRLRVIQYHLQAAVARSYEQIELLYHDDSLAKELLHDFDDSFQVTAKPLVVMAALADRTSPQSIPILPALLRGLHEVAPTSMVIIRENENVEAVAE